MTITTRRAAATAAALALIPAAAAHAAADPSTPSKADRTFMVKDYRGGLYEIATSKVVLAKAGAPAKARALATTLVTGHTKEVSELKKIATAQGVTLTATLTPSQNADVAKLKTLSGAKLGAQFAKLEYDDHTSEIGDYGDRYSATNDEALRAYIARWLPQYLKHASLANSAYRAIAGSKP